MEAFIQNNINEFQQLIKRISSLKSHDDNKTAKIINSAKIKGVKEVTKQLLNYVYQELRKSQSIILESEHEKIFLENIQSKSIRTLSGVTPVTIMTKPYPCPGKCIYCPSEQNMPKSYLAKEPGAQRALANNFNPYRQTYNRLKAYKINGHPTDKVEVIIIGGTWSYYKNSYQRWFIYETFRALNDFGAEIIDENLDHKKEFSVTEKMLHDIFKVNETAKSRCVGLSIETRPDFIDKKEAVNLRKLGVTKVQLGVQSLNEEVLKKINRGHTLKQTEKAFEILRIFGFKIQAHWMPNLPGSDVKKDLIDFNKMFSLQMLKPDEIKIYPCSLISSTPLEILYKKSLWKPYEYDDLVKLIAKCLLNTPRYCRVSRVIRDISSDDILVGNKKSNLRQDAEKLVNGKMLVEIRSREIKDNVKNIGELSFKKTVYETSAGKEMFLEMVNSDDKIAGFLRLFLPKVFNSIDELNNSTMIREVHVYGKSVPIGLSSKDAVQHSGIGKYLILKAEEISKKHSFTKISVISAVGTRGYYRNLGFVDGKLYQYKNLL